MDPSKAAAAAVKSPAAVAISYARHGPDDITVDVLINDRVVGLALGVGLTATSLAAIYYGHQAGASFIRGIFKRVFGADDEDRDVGDIGRGSLLVKLHCHTAESFLQFLEDYESGKIRERLIEELLKNDIKVESLTMEIKNMDEVKEHRKKLRKGLPGGVEEQNVKDENVKTDNFSEDSPKTEELQKDWEDKPTVAKERVQLNAEEKPGLHPLHYAVKMGQADVIDDLLNHADLDLKAWDEEGRTALHLATESGNTSMIKKLLEAGANPDIKDSRGQTQLHHAVEKDREDIVSLFLEHGADVNARNQDGKISLLLAVEWSSTSIVNHLEESTETRMDLQRRLYELAQTRQEVIYKLLEHGADVNATDKDEKTPLHLAVEWGSTTMVKLLEECDNTRMHPILTGLVDRLADMHREFIGKLLEHGAKINATDKDGKTPLHLAVESGITSMVKLIEESAETRMDHEWTSYDLVRILQEIIYKLLKHGADINARDKNGKTPLHLAVEWGSTSMVKLFEAYTEINLDWRESLNHLAKTCTKVINKLLEHGADIKAEDKDGQTPWNLAAEILMQKGAEIKRRDGLTALHLAALLGWEEVITSLIEGSIDVNTVDESGKTALYYALQSKNVKAAAKLLAAGANLEDEHRGPGSSSYTNINVDDENGMTVLFYAMQSGNTGIVDKLVSAGADVNAKDTQRRTQLHLAAKNGLVNVIDLLIKHGACVNAVAEGGETALFYAVQSGNTAVVERLVEAGADVNIKQYYGWTVLHLAAKKANEEIIDQLIACKADINVVNRAGETALFYAVESGNTAVVERLVEAGADVNIKYNHGRTVLHLAAEKAKKEILDQLIARKADINVVNKDGETALFYAVQSGNTAVVERLVEAGADVNIKYNHGKTVLHLAAEKAKKEILDQLIAHRADINVVNKDGETALFYAVQSGNTAVVERLVEAGADVNVKDSQGKTPLHLAAQRGKEQIFYQLIKHNADMNAVDVYGKTALFYDKQRWYRR